MDTVLTGQIIDNAAMTKMLPEFILRLAVAGILGFLIGLEREYRAKEAGTRTHFLVAIGSALIMIASQWGFLDVLGRGMRVDASRVAAQIVSGIGFIGAGTIIMPGVKIGSHCVIGSGSIVTKNVMDESVVCGVPAKVVCTVLEYAEKCKNQMPENFDEEAYKKDKAGYLKQILK